MENNKPVKLYVLVLNPMRDRIHVGTALVGSLDKEKIIKYYDSLLVEPYFEEGSPSFKVHGSSRIWKKSFKKNSLLEWYNPCFDIENGDDDYFGHGIREYSVAQQEYEQIKERLIKKDGILFL